MIELTKWLRAELVTRAEHDHPWEACGLISRPRKAGPVHDRLLHLWAAENAAEDPETSFLIAPQDQFDILAQIERMGHDLVGLYHSHPRSGPEPSERDREIAQLWAGLTWVIVGRRPCSCLPVPIVGTAADNDLIPDEDCEEDCEGRGHHVEFWVGELASGQVVYRRSRDAIAFYGGDVHLILFRPHAGVGNYSAWGFHLRLRADGRWHHLLCKAGMRLPTNPDGRQHEIAVWRSVRPTSGRGRRRGERIGRKAYVRLRTSRHRHRGGAASA